MDNFYSCQKVLKEIIEPRLGKGCFCAGKLIELMKSNLNPKWSSRAAIYLNTRVLECLSKSLFTKLNPNFFL